MAFDLIIVDPSPTMKKIYQTALPETQYRLHFANRLEELWPLLESISPELLIADHSVFENLQEVKEFSQKIQAAGPVPYFLTGGLFDQVPRDYLAQLRPEKTLVKPIPLDTLAKTVKEIIEKNHVPDTLPEELPEFNEPEWPSEAINLPPELKRQVQLLVRQEVLDAERELEKRIKASLLRELRTGETWAGGPSEINKVERKG